jgi:transcriptional regulator with XRE-family HTH domain
MKSPLRKVRESQDMTLNDLAARVGSDVGNLSRIERGTQMPSKDLAEKICSILGRGLNEMHLFFPERYPEYEPLQSHSVLPRTNPSGEKAREAKAKAMVGRMKIDSKNLAQ